MSSDGLKTDGSALLHFGHDVWARRRHESYLVLKNPYSLDADTGVLELGGRPRVERERNDLGNGVPGGH